MSEPKTTTYRSCVVSIGDGIEYALENTIISYDDWKQTPFGQVNFGSSVMLPARFVPLSKDLSVFDEQPAFLRSEETKWEPTRE